MYYPQSTKLVDICAEYYKGKGLEFSAKNPDVKMYEEWIEYAFKDLRV